MYHDYDCFPRNPGYVPRFFRALSFNSHSFAFCSLSKPFSALVEPCRRTFYYCKAQSLFLCPSLRFPLFTTTFNFFQKPTELILQDCPSTPRKKGIDSSFCAGLYPLHVNIFLMSLQ